ncbi:MAG: SIS domain-containing protein [Gammaproteobacteria bacterium]|nr:SIS domain-containing protein [Gammaproteobacteria bacterium]
MLTEAGQSARIVRTQFAHNAESLAALGDTLRSLAPFAVVTCGRGSSDHAATFARYLAETRLRLLTASVSPSVSSVYGVSQDLRRCVFLAMSQSGASPDLLAAADSAARAGALVVALVNAADSPLARAAHHVVPLHAGTEHSVAATKSYIATLAASLQLVAAWGQDSGLAHELAVVPDALERAWSLDWSPAVDALKDADHLFVIGRGLGLSVAQEAALKLKETCGLHAEAFSGAELRHGPMALIARGVPALVFIQDDPTRAGLEALARDLLAAGVTVIVAGGRVQGALNLENAAVDAVIAPLAHALAFYRLADTLAAARGLDPDRPPLLRKVTETR